MGADIVMESITQAIGRSRIVSGIGLFTLGIPSVWRSLLPVAYIPCRPIDSVSPPRKLYPGQRAAWQTVVTVWP